MVKREDGSWFVPPPAPARGLPGRGRCEGQPGLRVGSPREGPRRGNFLLPGLPADLWESPWAGREEPSLLCPGRARRWTRGWTRGWALSWGPPSRSAHLRAGMVPGEGGKAPASRGCHRFTAIRGCALGKAPENALTWGALWWGAEQACPALWRGLTSAFSLQTPGLEAGEESLEVWGGFPVFPAPLRKRLEEREGPGWRWVPSGWGRGVPAVMVPLLREEQEGQSPTGPFSGGQGLGKRHISKCAWFV